MKSFNRIRVEVASYVSVDDRKFVNVSGNCESAYIDAVAYMFQANSVRLSGADLMNSGDDDDSFE